MKNFSQISDGSSCRAAHTKKVVLAKGINNQPGSVVVYRNFKIQSFILALLMTGLILMSGAATAYADLSGLIKLSGYSSYQGNQVFMECDGTLNFNTDFTELWWGCAEGVLDVLCKEKNGSYSMPLYVENLYIFPESSPDGSKFRIASTLGGRFSIDDVYSNNKLVTATTGPITYSIPFAFDFTGPSVNLTGGTPIPEPKIDFTYQEQTTPMLVNFQANADYEWCCVYGYQWATSDGQTASGETASFTFKEPNATVTLTATGPGGTTSVSKTINFSIPVVTSVKSKYADNAFYLDIIDHNVEYTATVDWAGKEPGTVRFITPTNTFPVTTTGTTARQTFNMGKDFGLGGKLKVVAISKDGKASPEQVAGFTIMSKPVLMSDIVFMRNDSTGGFSYVTQSSGFSFDLIKYDGNTKSMPDKFPVFKKNPLNLKIVPSVKMEVSSEGKAKINLNMASLSQDLNNLKLGGKSSVGIQSIFKGEGIFQNNTWNWDGCSVGVSESASLKLVQPFPMPGLIPIPM